MLFTLGFTVGSCSDDDDAVLQAGYGYAQFKLYKSCLAETKVTRASTNELNYLRDAQKMKIVLINQEDGTEVVQTVGLEAMGDDRLCRERRVFLCEAYCAEHGVQEGVRRRRLRRCETPRHHAPVGG